MNLYLDTSALVKLYIREQGTDDVKRLVSGADFTGISLIALAESNAALARAVNAKGITRRTGEKAVQMLLEQWPRYVKIPVNEKVVTRAAELAWNLGLRGYDAIHLASAERWQEVLGSPVTLVTYDRQLAMAGVHLGMVVQPQQH